MSNARIHFTDGSSIQDRGCVAPRRSRRAFSLLELVIVIGIILILAALVLAVGTGLMQQGEARQTRDAMQLAESAIEEWERASSRQFTYGTNGQPPIVGMPASQQRQYDFQESVADNTILVDLLGAKWLGGLAESKAMLAKIDGRLLRTVAGGNPTSPQTELVDAWGARMYVVFPGREWASTDGVADKDLDGTLYTAQEKRLGRCKNKRLLLVSAGVDGFIGQLDGNTTQETQAEDNVYSYEPVTP